jgi:hypothetical protein
MKTIEYPYKPRLRTTLLVISFGVALAAGMGYAALSNDRGLIINGILRFGPLGATIVYWCLAGIGAVCLVIGLAMLVANLTSKARLRLTPTEFSAPRHAFDRTTTTIPVAEIQAIQVYSVRDQHFLDIAHGDATLTILRSCLPSTAAFEEVCGALRTMVAARGG